MALGEQATETEVIVDATFTAILAEPDFIGSSAEVATMVAVPAAEGVNIPAEVIVPPVAVQFTGEL